MSYLLFAIAGLWMADGVALLIAPLRMMDILKESLATAPTLTNWSALSALFGAILVYQSGHLDYSLLWLIVGLAMVVKGLFFYLASAEQRQNILKWCLTREAIDYRFWGLGLCTLSLLLLDAVGILGPK